MKRFLISAEFHAPSKARDKVSRVLSSLGETYEPQKSLWIVYSDCTKDEIGKRVRSVMDNQDHLLVTNIGGVYFVGQDQGFNRYLTQHINQHSQVE